jgi:uncharacterized protein DUF5681
MRYAWMRSAGEQISPWKLTSTPARSFTEASPKLHRRRMEGAAVSDEQASPPLTGRARSLANLKRYPKGQTGNPSGRTKDLHKFGDILMKEFYKTVTAQLGGKTVNKMQGEIVAMQLGRRALAGEGGNESPTPNFGFPTARLD